MCIRDRSITLFLLKSSSKGDETSISVTLKELACKKVVEKNIINRTFKIKNIYTSLYLNNLLIICIFYSNEKTKIYL